LSAAAWNRKIGISHNHTRTMLLDRCATHCNGNYIATQPTATTASHPPSFSTRTCDTPPRSPLSHISPLCALDITVGVSEFRRKVGTEVLLTIHVYRRFEHSSLHGGKPKKWTQKYGPLAALAVPSIETSSRASTIGRILCLTLTLVLVTTTRFVCRTILRPRRFGLHLSTNWKNTFRSATVYIPSRTTTPFLTCTHLITRK